MSASISSHNVAAFHFYIGIAGNAAMYTSYLVLTAFGVGPKAAMPAFFLLCVLCTYGLNRRSAVPSAD